MKVRAIQDVNNHVVDECDHSGLSPLKEYVVIEIDDEHFRVVDDDHEPILYPKPLFDIVDSSIPDDWVKETFDDGEYYISPREFQGYFFEDYFEGKINAVDVFKAYVNKHVLAKK